MDVKTQWCKRCVEAVGRVQPKVAGYFVCPLCLNCYDEVDDVTREHAPPKSLGGHSVALTCRECNSTAGHTLDVHARRFENVIDLAAKRLAEPTRVRLEFGGGIVPVDLTSTEAGISLAGIPRRSVPSQREAVFGHFERLAESGNWEGEAMRITFVEPCAKPNVNASWLRAAYLVAFASLGYRYILRSELDAVRKQISDPAGNHAPRAVGVNPKLDPDGRALRIIEQPQSLSCVLVTMGRWGVFLPGLGIESDFYGRLSSHEPWPPRETLVGKRVSWPKMPELQLDWIDQPEQAVA